MIEKYFLNEHKESSKLNAVFNDTLKKIPLELQVIELDRTIVAILDSIKSCSDEKILNLQIKLLSISLNKELKENIHISFSKTLNELEYDEITILSDIHSNNYEFVATYDYEKGKGFFNFQYSKFDYPKDALDKPDQFWFYIFHLQDILKIIRWPIYKKEALIEGGIQNGEIQLSRLIETAYGMGLNKCLFD